MANLNGLRDWVGMAPRMGPESHSYTFPLGRPMSRKAGKQSDIGVFGRKIQIGRVAATLVLYHGQMYYIKCIVRSFHLKRGGLLVMSCKFGSTIWQFFGQIRHFCHCWQVFTIFVKIAFCHPIRIFAKTMANCCQVCHFCQPRHFIRSTSCNLIYIFANPLPIFAIFAIFTIAGRFLLFFVVFAIFV